jgi:hypothetical protein
MFKPQYHEKNQKSLQVINNLEMREYSQIETRKNIPTRKNMSTKKP